MASTQFLSGYQIRAMIVLAVIAIGFGSAYFWLTRVPPQVDSRIEEGIQALDSGDVEKAFGILSDLHQADPGESSVTYLLAVTQSMRGDL
ncbi:MAG: hypothetical protein KDA80_22185, partial [Planctomycetaceae bacterium]|nr:hypothetical protein [Planctomycetaceae bacterium]